MFFNSRRNVYDAGEGPVRHLDGSSLLRPIDPPKPQLIIMGAFVVAAIIIGGVLLFNVLDNVTHSAERAQQSVEQNLARPAAMESLPNLPSLIGLDNEGIKAAFAGAGYIIADKTAMSGGADDGSLDLIKLPSDVSVEQAALMYAQGIPKLSAADATLLLNGSWQFTTTPGDYLNMSVKYADFSSGSVEAAVQTALVSEGLDATTLGEAGVDDSGNTFQTGTVDVGGTIYQWRISAIGLSSVYDVKGLPETAVYVGIRLFQ
ncbi:MAG: teichoic acid transporter [Gordonibacter sp.]|uniref:teichoic acid transporter n=1 Tax=Gordonibacter sp. TaxID=1968902 RepID=UPI002FC6A121